MYDPNTPNNPFHMYWVCLTTHYKKKLESNIKVLKGTVLS